MLNHVEFASDSVVAHLGLPPMISMFLSARAPRRPRVRFVPTVAGLEARVVLSAAPHHAAKAHHAQVAHHAAKAHHSAVQQAATAPQAVATQVAAAAAPQAGAATVPAASTTPTVPTTTAPATTASSLNQGIVAFLSRDLGQRIGSGECADLAVEALRVAGAKFANIAPDSPNPGDYVWGTLVKTYSGQAVDSAPGAAIQPGDVLQFDDATFSNGVSATHHTAVVAAVDPAGRVTEVYQQNVSSDGGPANRTDTLSPLDLSGLTGGTVAVYQPVARVASAGSATFTVVNNASTPETITLGGMVVALTAADTAGSMMTFTASGPAQLVVGGQGYATSDGGGYQIVGAGNSVVLAPVA